MDVRAVLAECELFAALEPAALDALARQTVPMILDSGAQLFKAGDPSDAVYIVATGRLRVSRAGSVLGYAGRLEPLGEVGLISGEVRSADVHAVRDSVLLRIGGGDLLDFLLAHPSALVATARVLIQRLTKNQRSLNRQSARSARTFAILPASADVDAAALARAMATALGEGVRLLDEAAVDAELGAGHARSGDHDRARQSRLTEWLNGLEQNHRHLIYAGNPEADAWTQRCLHQADRVLIAAHAEAAPHASATVTALKHSGVLSAVELILLTRAGGPARVAEWKALTGARAHYFVAPGDLPAVARLARLVSGRGIGLVLGGGGARGFAHIGLLRALDELRIPVDSICGSSMGAFVAALRALGYSSHEMRHVARDTFVDRALLNDYLFPPRVSLIRGRKFTRHLREIFGERRIEDLNIPYFCVSTNLTRGTAVVHDEGPLAGWLAASMCVPGFAPPIVWKNDLLVDGAVANSLPTDLMQALERGPIIASDVSTEGSVNAVGVEGPDPEALLNWRGDTPAPGLREILFRTATLTSESGVRRRAEAADVYLRMPVGDTGMFDWKRMDETIERGYVYAHDHLKTAHEKLLA